MRIALLQIASPSAESFANRRRRIDALVTDESALAEADLLVLPELWGVGAFATNQLPHAVEPHDGPTVTLAKSWARIHNLAIHAGSFVEGEGQNLLNTTLFNTSVLIDPTGAVLAKYRKVHLFGEETTHLSHGENIAQAAAAGLLLGLATCYDIRFPELFRSILDIGANAFAVAAAWPTQRIDAWQLFTTARAAENQSYLIGCNAVGEQNGVALGGKSRVVDPWGNVLAEADDREGFTYVDIDIALIQQARNAFPVLQDRRLGPKGGPNSC